MDSHVEYFPENLGDYSGEQGERFHQEIKVMEQIYQGRQMGWKYDVRISKRVHFNKKE